MRERPYEYERNRQGQGSPPLVRERPLLLRRIRTPLRITPARAGKTLSSTGTINGSRDHPRSCGKDPVNHLTGFGSVGSPPLVRERRRQGCLFRRMSGITPARAGKTYKRLRQQADSEDHPRSCGKDCIVCDKPMMSGGSPPLVRERH